MRALTGGGGTVLPPGPLAPSGARVEEKYRPRGEMNGYDFSVFHVQEPRSNEMDVNKVKVRATPRRMQANINGAESMLRRTYVIDSTQMLRPVVMTEEGAKLDSYAVSHVTCDREGVKVLNTDENFKNFTVIVKTDGVERKRFVSGVCAHTQQTMDRHKLCRACELLVTGDLCRSPDVCTSCRRMTRAERARRRFKVPESGCLKFQMFGDVYEAARLFERHCYVEGVLWLLASSLRVDVNLQALKRCRANIESMLTRQCGAPIFYSRQTFDMEEEDRRPDDRKRAVRRATGRYVKKGGQAIRMGTADEHLARLQQELDDHRGDRYWLEKNRRSEMPLEYFVTAEGDEPHRTIRQRARQRGYESARMDRATRTYSFHIQFSGCVEYVHDWSADAEEDDECEMVEDQSRGTDELPDGKSGTDSGELVSYLLKKRRRGESSNENQERGADVSRMDAEDESKTGECLEGKQRVWPPWEEGPTKVRMTNPMKRKISSVSRCANKKQKQWAILNEQSSADEKSVPEEATEDMVTTREARDAENSHPVGNTTSADANVQGNAPEESGDNMEDVERLHKRTRWVAWKPRAGNAKWTDGTCRNRKKTRTGNTYTWRWDGVVAANGIVR